VTHPASILGHLGRVLPLSAALALSLAATPGHTEVAPPSAASAVPDTDAQSVYGSWSAFGASVGYAHRVNAHWLARAQLNTGNPAHSKGHATLDGIRFETSARTGGGFSTFSDYYPSTGSGFHLTGGLIYSQIKPELTGQADGQGNYQLNGHSYTAAQVGTLSAHLKNRPLNLYLGGGWESAPIEAKGWRFMSDAGLFTSGRPQVSLTATGANSNPALQADLDAERSRLVKGSLGLSLQLGAAYAF
jgi:hypothetical protein